MKKYRVLGRNDEQTTCDCCGRTNLKLTVILEDNETGEVVRYGVNCAAKATGWTAKVVNEKLALIDREQQFIRRQATIAAKRRGEYVGVIY